MEADEKVFDILYELKKLRDDLHLMNITGNSVKIYFVKDRIDEIIKRFLK